jgi:chromosome segregation ATPase
LESQVRDLNQNIDTLNTNLRDANSKVASGDEALRGKDSELSRAQTANSSLTQENSRLSSQVQQIAAAQKEAAAAKAEAGLYMEHVASQEASIVVLTQERDKLKAELEQAKKTISLLDVANNDVSWSLGYLGHPVFVPEMLPPDMDY